jgi:hypothetical protein
MLKKPGDKIGDDASHASQIANSCMIAMPNPDTIAAAYSVQTSIAAARAVPPITGVPLVVVIATIVITAPVRSARGAAGDTCVRHGCKRSANSGLRGTDAEHHSILSGTVSQPADFGGPAMRGISEKIIDVDGGLSPMMQCG